MRKILTILLLISTTFPLMAQKTIMREINESVIYLTLPKSQLRPLGWPNGIINTIAIKSTKGIIIIDTQNSPMSMQLIKNAIEEHWNSSVYSYIINSHGLSCHTGGNCLFKNETIVAQRNCKDEIEDFNEIYAGQAMSYISKNIDFNSNLKDTFKIQNAETDSIQQTIDYLTQYQNDIQNNYIPRYPNIVFDDQLTLHSGDKTIELTYMGKGHGNADIAVYIPEEKLLTLGNILHLGANSPAAMPTFYPKRENDIRAWIAGFDKILKPENHIEHVLFTHIKTPMTRENVEFARDYCKLVYEKVLWAKRNGYEIETVQDFEAFAPLFKKHSSIISMNDDVREMHKKNINIIWKYINL